MDSAVRGSHVRRLLCPARRARSAHSRGHHRDRNSRRTPSRQGLQYDWRVVAKNRGGATPRAYPWTFVTQRGVLFVRGDVDGVGNIDITDAVFLLNFLFQGGPTPPCMDAADVDDDGGQRPSITDAIFLLNWLFQGGRPPPPPTPSTGRYGIGDCGIDPTDRNDDRIDEMDCEVFDPCP